MNPPCRPTAKNAVGSKRPSALAPKSSGRRSRSSNGSKRTFAHIPGRDRLPLSIAAELKDDETPRHIDRMSRYCALLAGAPAPTKDKPRS